MHPAEDEYLDAVVEAAGWSGWLVMHTRPALTQRGQWVTPVQGDVGYPDLTLVHGKARRAMFVELKTPDGRLTKGQTAWGLAMISAGLHHEVVRTSDDSFPQRLADLAKVPLSRCQSCGGMAAVGTE